MDRVSTFKREAETQTNKNNLSYFWDYNGQGSWVFVYYCLDPIINYLFILNLIYSAVQKWVNLSKTKVDRKKYSNSSRLVMENVLRHDMDIYELCKALFYKQIEYYKISL